MMNTKKTAVFIVLNLIIGIIATGYIIGSAVEPVSAGDGSKDATKLIPWYKSYKSFFGFGEALKEEAKFKESFLTDGGFLDGLVSALSWAIVVYIGVKIVSEMLGVPPEVVDARAKAASAGTFAGRLASNLGAGAGWGTVIGIAVALVVYITLYEEKGYRLVEFKCHAWDAPVRGENCELCNQQEFGCSIYQCRSLGQACRLINQGTSEEKCVWINPNDVTPPEISVNDSFLPEGYRYTPDNAVSPPDRGVVIVSDKPNGCIPAFTPVTFGINTRDEEGNPEQTKCKIDYERKENFEEMGYYFGGSSSSKDTHVQTIALPGQANAESENITLRGNGNIELYVKCRDENGNENLGSFVFKFCVDPEPKTSPPFIYGANFINNAPIAHGKDSVNFELYLNEPSECRWSRNDESYESMQNEMDCETEIIQINARGVYTCKTNLTGIKDNQENKFYFRCKDQPGLKGTERENERNSNSESYVHTFIGTRPLYIDSIEPNDTTIKDSTESVKTTLKVKTSAGYNEGESVCYYGEDEDSINIRFFNTGSYEHSSDLYLPGGEYEFYVKCVDAGGNSDTKKISFKVESDSNEPIITRAYKEENYLKITTNEPSECVYDVKNCEYLFEDGIPMTEGKENTYFVEWSTKTKFYIKCQDKYGNRPAPNKCSAVIKPIEK